ncbi:MAG: nuclease-related domain-containing protein [Clostridium sp.]|nr:nuclease-related domain-containing protein [Clostridium sp.]
MAKIIHNNNSLENGLTELKKKSTSWLIVTLISFFLFIPTNGISLPIFMLGAIMYNKYSKPLKLRKIGLEGENRISKVFENLPDSYTVISNLNLDPTNNWANIDNLVIGTNGLFVIKTKNINGKIKGDASDKYLVQHKTGRKGGHYSKDFYNPIKQVNSQIYKLSLTLNSNNLNERIQGIVYFSNPDCKVYVNSVETPVFSHSARGPRELCEFITKHSGSIIPVEKQEAIIKTLTKGTVLSDDKINSSYDNLNDIQTENIYE